MWSNNNAGSGGGGGDHRHHRAEKDRPYEVLHYSAPKPGESGGGSNGNRASDGNKNRFGDVGVGRYRVVEQVRDLCDGFYLLPILVQFQSLH